MEPLELVMDDLLALPVRELKPYSGNWLRPMLVGGVLLILAIVLGQVFGQIVKGVGDFFSLEGETSVLAFLVALFGNLYFIWCFVFLACASWFSYRGALHRFGTKDGVQGVHWKFDQLYRSLMRAGIEEKSRGQQYSREQLAEIVALNKESTLKQAAAEAVEWASSQTIRAVKECRDEPSLVSRIADTPYWAAIWIVALVGLITIPIYVKNGMSILALLPQEALLMLFGALGGLIIGYVDYLLGAREWVEHLLGESVPSSQSSHFVLALLGVVALFMTAGLYRVEPDKAYTGLAEVKEAHYRQLLRGCDADRFKSTDTLCVAAHKGIRSLFEGENRLLSIEQESLVDSRTLAPYQVACISPTYEWMTDEGLHLSQNCYRLTPSFSNNKLAYR